MKTTMNKKGQTQRGVLSVLLGGAILLAIVSILFSSLFSEAQTSYTNIQYNESQYAAFNTGSELNNITSEMNDQFTNLNSSGTNVGDVINVATTGGYNTIRLFGALPEVYRGIITSIATTFEIDQALVNLVVLIIIAALIGLFILLVFRVAVI